MILSRYRGEGVKAPGSFGKSVGYCLLCGANSSLAWCRQCHEDMRVHAPSCAICSMPVKQEGLCGNCIVALPPYDSCLTLYHYRYPADQIIGKYKYRYFAELAGCFAHYFYEEHSSEASRLPDLLLPVPLHWQRQWWRGFNQSALFAEKLSSLFGIECCPRGASRVRATKPQIRLDPKQRKANIAHAFRLNDCYTGKSVALVDDVITTGTTVYEMCRLLKKQRVKSISLWTIAKATVAD